MSTIKDDGCELCRAGTFSTQWPPAEHIAVSPESDIYLRRCEHCGTFWVISEGDSFTIDQEKAKLDFPDAF
jgi:hypothetical protein